MDEGLILIYDAFASQDAKLRSAELLKKVSPALL